jgi:hypothetical protein
MVALSVESTAEKRVAARAAWRVEKMAVMTGACLAVKMVALLGD